MSDGQDTATLDGKNDLRQFLKVVKPDWSVARRRRRAEINKVAEKLCAIGVKDSWDLMSRVTTNRINEDLTAAGYSRFSRETLERIRKHTSFFRALENLTEANFRQTGDFAPVPQLLSKVNLRALAEKKKSEQRVSNAEHSIFNAGETRLTDLDSGASGPRNQQMSFFSGTRDKDDGNQKRSLSVPAFPGGTQEVGLPDEDGVYDSAPRLRGCRGEVRGTAGAASPRFNRPEPEVTLPSLQTTNPRASRNLESPFASGSDNPATACGTPDLNAARSTKITCASGTSDLSAQRSKASTFGDGIGTFQTGGGGGGFADWGGRGRILLERARSMVKSSQMDPDRPGSPKLRVLDHVTFEEELEDLQHVAKNQREGSIPAPVEEAYEKLARMGEEELFFLRPCLSFAEQGGTDAQALRIAAHFAKLGVDPFRVVRSLRSRRTVSDVFNHLDQSVVRQVSDAAEQMLKRTRSSGWAGFPRTVPASAVGQSRSSSVLPGTAPRHSVMLNSFIAGTPVQVEGPPVLQYATDMLKEQKELEAKDKMYRIMVAQGPVLPQWYRFRTLPQSWKGPKGLGMGHCLGESTMRTFITENIKNRLKEEKDCEAEKMEVQQTCSNIRRQLSVMGNAKRELNTLRRSIEAEDRGAHYKDAAEKGGLVAAFAGRKR